MAAMKENSKKILTYLQENNDIDQTAKDVAAALDLDPRSVNGSFTSFQKKGLGVRVEAEVELEDGSHSRVKFLKLTEAGMSFSPDEDAE